VRLGGSRAVGSWSKYFVGISDSRGSGVGGGEGSCEGGGESRGESRGESGRAIEEGSSAGNFA
jgi:hypothetical protein